MYLGSLIQALKKQYNSSVVVLVDEYDAPVTRHMDNQKLAETNAGVLHDFFASLKDNAVSSCVHFSFVTGITRYALTSMDSGPNHFKDISLEPKYAGICGFTLEEFDSLFANRLEPTLEILKKTGEMESSATVADLKKEILRWYDGYNWGGETRVLNPYTILNFFEHNEFDTYWAKKQSSWPSESSHKGKTRRFY
jgi:hypothetical protein